MSGKGVGSLSKKLVLKGATLISGRDSEVIENSRVVLNGSVIESVGKADKKDLLEKDDRELEVIALDGMTLMPGLIDTHIHLVGNGEISVFVNLFESSMKRAIKAVRYLQDLLSMGITTVRSGGGRKRLFRDGSEGCHQRGVHRRPPIVGDRIPSYRHGWACVFSPTLDG